jgi:hypothetical protein
VTGSGAAPACSASVSKRGSDILAAQPAQTGDG